MTPTPSRPVKRRRRTAPMLWGGAAVLLVVAAGFVVFQMRGGPPKDPYRTEAVTRGPITKAVSASGALEALVTVEVGSQISGQIREVRVDFNDEVKKGQVLAILDPQTFESRVAQGRADIAAGEATLNQARAELAAAEADFRRKKVLVEQGYYSPSTLDLAEAAYKRNAAAVEAARARIAQSRASLRSQEVDLTRTVIVSPIDGVVVDRQIEPGQTVAASLQAPVLFRIAQDLSKVQVKISVDEADIGQVAEGQAVRFTVDAFPDDNFQGVVTQVRKQPVTESNVVAYTVMAEADNPRGRLLPGMTANADIIIEQRPNVLKVPAAALRWKPASANLQAASGPPGFGGPPRNSPGAGGGRVRMGGPRVAEELDLDASQRERWSVIQADLRAKMASSLAEGGDREAMRAAMRRNMESALAQLEPYLKPEQKAKLSALKATLAEGRAGADGFTGGVVYVLRDGKPVPVPVQVGATDGSSTQIRGALQPGDLVITGGGPKAKVQARSPMGGPGGGAPVRVRM
ncbi:MAG: efflux RND transporter periplasmic adaptor subunit [Phenylobacterium sp.]|uniref:efflux RND transporter periplasmic adaptor subunit n=1 Tax=Phenylobacterium sp. TaxID=1871053 RepID=UPI00391C6856